MGPVGQLSISDRSARTRRRHLSRSTRRRVVDVAIFLSLVLVGIVYLLPIAWMISTSLKTAGDAMLFPPKWIPTPPLWHNFVDAWNEGPFTTFLINSVIITSLALLGQVVSCAVVAFGFARLRAPGRDVLFFLVLATIMVPWQVTLVPTYILFHELGWVDTFLPLIVPSYFAVSAFSIFLLRQFFRGIPYEIEDAARIDGCGTFQVFSRIIAPLSKPALIAVGIFGFMAHWDDFLGPIIYLNETKKWTLIVGLFLFGRGTDAYTLTKWNYRMALALLVMLPSLAIFAIAQRYFIQGIVITGVKG